MRAERLTAMLFAAALLAPWPALAQATVNDAGVITSLPDASVGEGGAQTGGEGQDDSAGVVVRCRYTSECSRGFGCQDGRCVWYGYRHATGVGLCDFSSVTALLFGGLVLAVRRGARRRGAGGR